MNTRERLVFVRELIANADQSTMTPSMTWRNEVPCCPISAAIVGAKAMAGYRGYQCGAPDRFVDIDVSPVASYAAQTLGIDAVIAQSIINAFDNGLDVTISNRVNASLAVLDSAIAGLSVSQ